MAPGAADVVKTTPYTGYKVEAYHTIYDKDGKVIDSHLESSNTYHVRNKVVMQAPKAPAVSAPTTDVPAVPGDVPSNPGDFWDPSWDPVNQPVDPAVPDGDFGGMLDEGSYGIL